MRIFLSYNHNMLHSKTQRISLPKITTTDQLISEIKKRLTVQQPFYIKFNIEGENVRVIEGWNLSHYGIKQGSSIHLEFYESALGLLYTPTKSNEGEKGSYSPVGHSAGNLEKIEEEEVDEEEETRTRKSSVFEHHTEEATQENQKLDSYLQRLLKAAKNGDLDEIKYILENNIALLNQFGQSGWALIHYVVYYNHQHILDYLISCHASLNLVTSEGWTPLQLTIKKQNFKMFKKLIKTKGCNMNQVTEKGTALHLAVKNNLDKFVEVLIERKVDDTLKDEQKKTAMEVCENEVIEKMLGDYKKKGSQEESEEKEKVVENQMSIFKGVVYRERMITHILKENYMVCDPYQGTLVKYEKKQDYPKKPKQVIPLLQITNVQILKKQDKKLLMKKGYNFIQILKPDKLILATKAYNSAVRWVQVIFEAATYVHKHNQILNNPTPANVKTIQIYDIQDQSEKELIDETSFKKDKNKEEPTRPTLKKSTSVFSEQLESALPFKKMTSVGNDVKVHFDAGVLNKSGDSETEERSGRKGKDTQVSNSDESQKEKSGPLSNYSSFASNGKNQNFSTMAEEIKIGISSFDVMKEVGSGSFGKVYMAKLRRTKEIFALKALKKSTLILKKQLKYAIGEVNILKKLYSPFILQLHYAFQTPHYLYLCLDFCPYGDLSQYLMNQDDGIIDQQQAKSIICQLIIAVQHMHSLNIIYRDMKPENVLIGADGFIRLADFGLSKGDVSNNLCVSFCGSPAYLSPEMLKQKGVGKQSDVYGLGCILYEMLVGEPPYYDDDMQVLYQNIQKGNLKFTGRMSNQAKQIIQLLLERNPLKRISLENMKKHSFFKDIDFEKLYRKQVGRLNVGGLDLDEDSDDEIQVLDSKKPAFIDADYPDDKKINRVNNFSFIRNAP